MFIVTKRSDSSGISGYSVYNKSYLTTEKGFYLNGFTTTIKQATKHNLYHAEDYGLQLVSRYTGIDQRLLRLDKIKESNTLSTTTIIYQVKTGSMINGKIYITAQILSEHDIIIMYNYRYRVNSRDYFNEENVMDNRITHKNAESGNWNNVSARWIRNRNRQEDTRRKYKER